MTYLLIWLLWVPNQLTTEPIKFTAYAKFSNMATCEKFKETNLKPLEQIVTIEHKIVTNCEATVMGDPSK